ncbi:MAG: MOSC domain-containing protein [Akkermansiaceae bacterium]|jgi:hypothetical protein
MLESIWVASLAGESMYSLHYADVEAGRGILGDRYHQGEGTFSRWQRPNRAVSLIEKESLESVRVETGIDLFNGRHRRNIVTEGVNLADLIGGHFRIGSVLFKASATCPPCRYLERILEQGVFNALRNRGGIRAEVMESGLIRAGDPVIPMGDAKRLP